MIKEWLTHKNYVEGVRIYLKVGKDNDLKRLLTSEKETPYKAQRLENALRSIYEGVQEVEEKETRLPGALVKTWPQEEEAVLNALRADWLKKFKEMQDLRSQLLLLPTDEQRGQVAHRILALDDECDDLYAKRDYYKQHGKLPTKSEESAYAVDPVMMAARMQLLQRYIRRERTLLKTNPGNAAAAQRKVKFTKEYNHYAQRFGRNHIVEEGQPGTAAEK